MLEAYFPFWIGNIPMDKVIPAFQHSNIPLFHYLIWKKIKNQALKKTKRAMVAKAQHRKYVR
jgi:hypothetical protein